MMVLRFYISVVIALFLFSTPGLSKKQKAFSFVQLTDTQLGMGGYDHDVANLKMAVDQINQLNPDFVVVCGDHVHHTADTAYADFRSIMNKLKMKYHLAVGNHDVGKIPNDSTLLYYRKTMGKDYFSFQHKGYAFIVTNSLLWKTDVENESAQHDAWFKKTVEKQSAKNKPMVVIGHFPIYNEELDEEETYYNFPIHKRLELLELFAQNNVKAYLSGHMHQTIINSYKNIQLVTAETTSKNFDKRPFGFRYWEVKKDTLYHSFVPLSKQLAIENN